MLLLPGDLKYFLAAGAGVFVIVCAGFFGLRCAGYDVRGVLRPCEWKVLAKIASIGVLTLVFLYAMISREFPAALFVYGRF